MTDQPPLDWAVARRPMPGQVACGDVATVHTSGSRLVLAVIDGLGHGPDAAKAATLAAEVVGRHRTAEPADLLLLLHSHLAESRGATATVATVDGASGQLDWLGVGNVDGVVVRADGKRPLTHGVFLCRGVLGHQMPRKLHRPEPVVLRSGDCIVIATDGVRGDLADAVRPRLDVGLADVGRLADRILRDFAIADDDALVLVARYHPPVGGPPPA
jgi:hypothetical protein